MGPNEHKKTLNQELDQFNSILGEVLPRYISLMKMKYPSKEDEKELDEIEHFLFEVNGKIAEIKTKLDQDSFGEILNLYYKTKQEVKNGDPIAKKRLAKLRVLFSDYIHSEDIFIWN